jgi:segregation and condensation protein B
MTDQTTSRPHPACQASREQDGDRDQGSEPQELQAGLEALLLIADEPVSEVTLAATMQVPAETVARALAGLADFYDRTGRGFELCPVAAGWRYYTRAEHADLIARHLVGGQQAKLSRPALETLAVVAYLQPVSRSRVSAIRAVNSDGVIKTLLTRELIAEMGTDEAGAALFATTNYFLERMGLTSLDELPELAPYLPDAGELEAELGEWAVRGNESAQRSETSPADQSRAPETNMAADG